MMKIMGTSTKGLCGRFLADCAGNDDEGQIKAQVLEQCEGGWSAEPRESVIGQHDIPCIAVESRSHRVGRLNSFVSGLVAAALKRPDHQLSIMLVVLDDQDLQ